MLNPGALNFSDFLFFLGGLSSNSLGSLSLFSSFLYPSTLFSLIWECPAGAPAVTTNLKVVLFFVCQFYSLLAPYPTGRVWHALDFDAFCFLFFQFSFSLSSCNPFISRFSHFLCFFRFSCSEWIALHLSLIERVWHVHNYKFIGCEGPRNNDDCDERSLARIE